MRGEWPYQNCFITSATEPKRWNKSYGWFPENHFTKNFLSISYDAKLMLRAFLELYCQLQYRRTGCRQSNETAQSSIASMEKTGTGTDTDFGLFTSSCLCTFQPASRPLSTYLLWLHIMHPHYTWKRFSHDFSNGQDCTYFCNSNLFQSLIKTAVRAFCST